MTREESQLKERRSRTMPLLRRWSARSAEAREVLVRFQRVALICQRRLACWDVSMLRKCEVCRKAFKAKPCKVAQGKARFCSMTCFGKSQVRGQWVRCHVCPETIWRRPNNFRHAKTQTFFCGPACRSRWNEKVMPAGEQHHGWRGGYRSYRRRAIKHYGAKCSSKCCPIPNARVSIRMLDVDHTDGNRKNNHLSNLRVLCVWCHAERTRASWK